MYLIFEHIEIFLIFLRTEDFIFSFEENLQKNITSKFCSLYVVGKPRGLRTARKHVNHRREQRWNDKDYKKAHLGTRWKANPFGGASHAKGIVLEKV